MLITVIPISYSLVQVDKETPQAEEDTLIVVCNQPVDIDEFTEQVNEGIEAEVSDGTLVYPEPDGDTVLTVDACGDINKTIDEIESLPNVDYVQRDLKYELLEDDVIEGEVMADMKVISDDTEEEPTIVEEEPTEEQTSQKVQQESEETEVVDAIEVTDPAEESSEVIEELAKEIADVKTNDAYYSYEWWLKDWDPDNGKYGHNVADAWNYAKSNKKVSVAVLDTGCNIDHTDLKANIDKTNMADASANPVVIGEMKDLNGHGTHVCGLVGAVADNSVGIAGVSYNANVIPVRVFNDDGGCYSSSLHRAYLYLEEKIKSGEITNLKVINMSLGGYTKGYYDNLLEGDIDRFYNEYGIITCCAGGNDEVTTPSYPSDFENSLAVTIQGKSGTEVYCDYNEYKDISAAGQTLMSTYIGGDKYCYMTGTSMASPVCAGIIALCWSAKPSTSAKEMREAVLTTAKPLISKKSASAGSINAVGILNYLGVIPDEDLPSGWTKQDNPVDDNPPAPTKPTINEPTTPSETNPTDPTEPVTPTDPTTQPTQPTQPTNPTTPVVTQPTKPPVTSPTTYVTKYKKYKKSFRVYWKKKSGVSGYQMRYSGYSNMKSPKTYSMSYKYGSKRIYKLKKKSNYYVQVRTYKTYKGKRYYSNWSKIYKVKTK